MSTLINIVVITLHFNCLTLPQSSKSFTNVDFIKNEKYYISTLETCIFYLALPITIKIDAALSFFLRLNITFIYHCCVYLEKYSTTLK